MWTDEAISLVRVEKRLARLFSEENWRRFSRIWRVGCTALQMQSRYTCLNEASSQRLSLPKPTLSLQDERRHVTEYNSFWLRHPSGSILCHQRLFQNHGHSSQRHGLPCFPMARELSLDYYHLIHRQEVNSTTIQVG